MHFVIFSFFAACFAQLYDVGTSQGNTFNPSFETAITTYTIDVPSTQDSVSFVPIAHDALEIYLDDCCDGDPWWTSTDQGKEKLMT